MDAVEQVGSGVRRIREICRDYGVAEPDYEISEHWVTLTFKRPKLVNGVRVPDDSAVQVTPEVDPDHIQLSENDLDRIQDAFGVATGQVTGQVAGQVMFFCRQPKSAKQIQEMLSLKHRENFLNNYLKPLLSSGWIVMTIPDKPRSSKQKYRLTEKGKTLLK